MDWSAANWNRRRKRWSRRVARDVRDLGPLVGVICCVLSAATAIEAIERVPIPRPRNAVRPILAVRTLPPVDRPASVASGPPSVVADELLIGETPATGRAGR